MDMTKEEICLSYKEAKDKAKQIMILAEMNCVKKPDIINILKEGGYSIEETVTRRKKKVTAKKPDTAKETAITIPVEQAEKYAIKIPKITPTSENLLAKKFVEAFDIIAGTLQESKEAFCGGYCKYKGIWNDELMGALSETEMCKSCPVNRLC